MSFIIIEGGKGQKQFLNGGLLTVLRERKKELIFTINILSAIFKPTTYINYVCMLIEVL